MEERDFGKYLILIVAVVAVVGLVVSDGGMTGFAVARGSRNATCRAAEPRCDAGLVCANNVCQAPRAAGQPCNKNTVCQQGLSCVQGKCRGSQPQGAACRVAAECQDGLFCINRACASPRAVGEVCNSQARCAQGLQCQNGVCARPLLPLGIDCRNSTQCASGICGVALREVLRTVAANGTDRSLFVSSMRCEELNPQGQPCINGQDFECATGLCAFNSTFGNRYVVFGNLEYFCEVLNPAGESCQVARECASGLCGVNTSDSREDNNPSRTQVCVDPGTTQSGFYCMFDRECASGRCGQRMGADGFVCE